MIAPMLLAAALAAVPAPAPVRAQPLAGVTFDGTIQTVAYRGDRIYLGGDFTHAIDRGGRLVARTRLAAVDARTGQLLPWNPSADARVRTLAANAAGVFVGGDFGQINGVGRDSLARLDPDTGALSPLFKHSIYGHPHTIALTGTTLYLGGTLTLVDNQPRGRLAAFDLATGALLTAWKPQAQNAVNAIAVSGDRLILGGAFENIGNIPGTRHLAAVDAQTGAVRPAFHASVAYTVDNVTLAGGALYAAVGGKGGRAIAIDPATGETRWTLTADGDVRAVVRIGDRIYVGGHFDAICGSDKVGDKGVCKEGSTPRIKLAAVDGAGRLLPWLADANGIQGVEAMAANPALGVFAAGGSFTTINGAVQRRFAQFQP
ncbi:outer membrane protein assembly factor BamB family protein [Hamadaea tsunoensis]|uniref:outer membrane protein assembly factor BamB family protein n=1 Tax=Hamadaea tsunoensis TaxID=53368 RepID=UPI00146FB9A7|nr:PQQ-binding-like beta-propeller repeat protein [Hamadaea tsunoensis]